jgi:probable phosphoglycerate mutase
MPLRLHLIRHGETEWSLSGRHTSRTDLPLTPRGEQAARHLGERLRAIGFARVFTSPRLRARQTCELAGLGSAAEIEPDLKEWDYGDYEGRRTADIHQTWPGWDLFLEGGPNGESPGQISDRADRLIARLRALEGEIALFTHGHFGAVLGVRWLGLPVGTGRHFPLGTASLSILGSVPGPPNVPVILLWNSG